MSASKNEKENNPEMNVNGIKNICSKYKKYIAIGAMLVLFSKYCGMPAPSRFPNSSCFCTVYLWKIC